MPGCTLGFLLQLLALCVPLDASGTSSLNSRQHSHASVRASGAVDWDHRSQPLMRQVERHVHRSSLQPTSFVEDVERKDGNIVKEEIYQPPASLAAVPQRVSFFDWLLGPAENFSCFRSGVANWSRRCIVNAIAIFALMLYLFRNLKIMSDVYWVPSILAWAKKKNLPPDVAGATVLAFGSSAPELCTSCVATFFIVNESGVGDIVGSAVHNILLIVGVAGVFSGRDVQLWWYPLSRDTVFFMTAIIELGAFLWDGDIQMWEAVVMILTYVVYIMWMYWNTRIYVALCGLLKLDPVIPNEEEDDEDAAEYHPCRFDPVEMAWHSMMPNPEKSSFPCIFLALANITILSYLMVDAARRFGIIVGIPSLFMGLVFLALGTSLPDVLGSLAAAKKGQADMAVSNAFGSNIFDVLIGLAVPWLLSVLLGKPIVFQGSAHLLYWILILMASMTCFIAVVAVNGWRLNVRMGSMLCLMYVIYVIWALMKSYKMGVTGADSNALIGPYS